MDEFDLIRRFFTSVGACRPDVCIGIGDDAAVVQVPPGKQLVIATDTLVEDVHFPASMPAHAVGYRALAVNLSDLAAMGAEPAWASLGLTVPDDEAGWLEGFAGGFSELASRFDVALIGGDTTRGPRCMTVTVHGLCEPGKAVLRSGAQPGDTVCVTGSLGKGGAGLRAFSESGPADPLAHEFLYPEPRIVAGRALARLASAMIDVSDGLLADLGHILEASSVGAHVDVAALPIDAAVCTRFGADTAQDLALGGGDDYELCCCIPARNLHEAMTAVAGAGSTLSRIGEITAAEGLVCADAEGRTMTPAHRGYRHFE